MSWMVPEGLVDILARNLKLDRNMISSPINHSTVFKKYHSLFEEDKNFGAVGNAYAEENWDYEEEMTAHANPEYEPEALLKCIETSRRCAGRNTSTRIVMTVPVWESQKYWQLIENSTEIDIICKIPKDCFGFIPESTLRGHATTPGSTRWPVAIIMVSNEKGKQRGVPEEMEEEMEIWLQNHTYRGGEEEIQNHDPTRNAKNKRKQGSNSRVHGWVIQRRESRLRNLLWKRRQ